MDTLGLLLAVAVFPANIQDRDGAELVFPKVKLLGSWPRMERVWADGGDAGELIRWVSSCRQWILEIVQRNADVKGSKLWPRRGVVDRPFSWLSHCCRSSKHDAYWNETGEAMVQVGEDSFDVASPAQETPAVGVAWEPIRAFRLPST